MATLADKFSSAGAQARQARYLLDDEAIVVDGQRREVVSRVSRLNNLDRGTYTKISTGSATRTPGRKVSTGERAHKGHRRRICRPSAWLRLNSWP